LAVLFLIKNFLLTVSEKKQEALAPYSLLATVFLLTIKQPTMILFHLRHVKLTLADKKVL
jgi:hypothetical protein